MCEYHNNDTNRITSTSQFYNCLSIGSVDIHYWCSSRTFRKDLRGSKQGKRRQRLRPFPSTLASDPAHLRLSSHWRRIHHYHNSCCDKRVSRPYECIHPQCTQYPRGNDLWFHTEPPHQRFSTTLRSIRIRSGKHQRKMRRDCSGDVLTAKCHSPERLLLRFPALRLVVPYVA